jgi:threonine/homoserine/homoserine lactone efflux protein
LAVLLETSVITFEVLRILAAFYLIYLAYQTFRSAKAGLDPTTELRLSARDIVLRGVFINLLSPKLTLFSLRSSHSS